MFAKTRLRIAGKIVRTFIVVRRTHRGLMRLIARTRFARCLCTGRTVRIRAGVAIAHVVDDALEGRTGERLALLVVRYSGTVGNREAFDKRDRHSLLNRLDRNIYVRVM
jgi:hypothetical protein